MRKAISSVNPVFVNRTLPVPTKTASTLLIEELIQRAFEVLLCEFLDVEECALVWIRNRAIHLKRLTIISSRMREAKYRCRSWIKCEVISDGCFPKATVRTREVPNDLAQNFHGSIIQELFGHAEGIRTPVLALKGPCPDH